MKNCTILGSLEFERNELKEELFLEKKLSQRFYDKSKANEIKIIEEIEFQESMENEILLKGWFK